MADKTSGGKPGPKADAKPGAKADTTAEAGPDTESGAAEDASSASKASAGKASRKPSVSPIIDLEATVVEGGGKKDAKPDAGETVQTATPADGAPGGAERRSGTDRRGASASGKRLRGLADRARQRTGHWPWGRIAAAAVAAIALLVAGIWIGLSTGAGNRLAAPQPDERLDALEATLNDVAGGQAALEQTLAGTDAALGDVSGRLDRLGQGLGDLQGQVAMLGETLDNLATGSPDGDTAGLPALQVQVSALAAKIDALQGEIAGLAPTTGADDDTARRLDEIAAAVATLQSAVLGDGSGIAPELAAIAEALAGLDARLGALEDAGAPVAGGTPPLLAAIAELQLAFDDGAAFGDALNRVAALAPQLDIYTPLRPHADAGIASVTYLRTRFAGLSGADDASNSDGDTVSEAPGFAAGLWQRVKGMVDVRRTDGVTADERDAAMAAASSALARDDLNGAVAAVSSVREGLTAREADWLSAAEARLAAEHAMDVLRRHAITALAAAERS